MNWYQDMPTFTPLHTHLIVWQGKLAAMKRMIRSLSSLALIALGADPTSAADDKSQQNLTVEKTDAMDPRPKCVDDPSYKSKAGLLCAQHAFLDCRGFEHVGFSPQEVDELLSKCPVSCRVEPCVSIDDDKDVSRREERSAFPTSPAVQQQDQRNIPTQYVRRRTFEHYEGACFEGWHASCQDNPSYVSPIQTDCSVARIFDAGKCAQAIAIGLTLTETNEMILNCPCSCEVECGTVQPVTSEIHSSDSEDGGGIISPVIAASNEMTEENMAEDGDGGGFSIQAVMEEYGVFIYAGIGAVVVFIGIVYVVRSYQRRNVENRDRSYSFDDYGSRTEVSGQSRSHVSFWGYN